MARLLATLPIGAALAAIGATACTALPTSTGAGPAAAPASPAPAAALAPAPARGTSRADFYGTWERVGSLNFDPTIPGNQPDRPPLTPKAQAQFDASIKSAAEGRPINDPHANCVPLGMPRMMNMVYLMEIYPEAEKTVIIAEESSQVRRIYTDGRPISDDLHPTYNGSSYGHWEGDILVSRTVAMRADTPINGRGLFHSGKLVVDERMWLESHDVLKNRMTLTDPETFATPWTVTKTYRRTKDEVLEYVCQENNLNPVGEDGVTLVILPTQKKAAEAKP